MSIPSGSYCYEMAGMPKDGRIPIRRCPYWQRQGEHLAYCQYLDIADNDILWEQIKICDINT